MSDIVKPEQQPLTLKERRDLLSFREKLAYDAIANIGGSRTPPSPTILKSLFKLYLAGKTCDEIARLNSNTVTLADVVLARVEDRWDERRTEYRESLMQGVQDKMLQTRLESASFLSDQLSAVHKAQGESIQRFIQTGDPVHLKGLMIHSIRNYKEAMDLLLTVTGQNPAKKVTVNGEVEHSHVVDGATVPAGGRSALSPKQAAAVVAALLMDGEEK